MADRNYDNGSPRDTRGPNGDRNPNGNGRKTSTASMLTIIVIVIVVAILLYFILGDRNPTTTQPRTDTRVEAPPRAPTTPGTSERPAPRADSNR